MKELDEESISSFFFFLLQFERGSVIKAKIKTIKNNTNYERRDFQNGMISQVSLSANNLSVRGSYF